MKKKFLKQLFIVNKPKPFKFYYLQKYKIRRDHIWARSDPHFKGPRSGSDRVGRFITGLALDRLPYRSHIFPDRRPAKISARVVAELMAFKNTVLVI